MQHPEPAGSNMPEKYVITIGRGFGSGGRDLGAIIARKLDIAFYDKRLLSEAARHAGLSEEYFRQNDERTPKYIPGLFSFNLGYSSLSLFSGSTPIGSDSIYQAQSEFIRGIADKAPCVIIGRSADHILRDCHNVLNVFVHSPREVCARRVLHRGDADSFEKAIALVDKTNKLRANFYNFYTDKTWGRADSYHLCVDSSKLDLDTLADKIIDFAAEMFRNALSPKNI